MTETRRDALGYLSLFATGCAVLALLNLHWHDGMKEAALWGFLLGINAVFTVKWLERR